MENLFHKLRAKPYLLCLCFGWKCTLCILFASCEVLFVTLYFSALPGNLGLDQWFLSLTLWHELILHVSFGNIFFVKWRTVWAGDKFSHANYLCNVIGLNANMSQIMRFFRTSQHFMPLFRQLAMTCSISFMGLQAPHSTWNSLSLLYCFGSASTSQPNRSRILNDSEQLWLSMICHLCILSVASYYMPFYKVGDPCFIAPSLSFYIWIKNRSRLRALVLPCLRYVVFL